MKKKSVLIVSCIIFVSTLVPLAQSVETHDEPEYEKPIDDLFTNCYIEITGSVQNQWKICFLKPFGDYRSTIAFWHLSLQDDACIKIYSHDQTELLYEHQGEKQLRIFTFAGTYIPTLSNEDDALHVEITGRTSFIMPYTNRNTINKEESERMDSVAIGGTERFANCYIEVEGHILSVRVAIIKLPNMLQVAWIGPTQEDILFGAYSYILFEEDATIKVYDQKEGQLLFSHDGSIDPLITLIGFSGSYTFVDPPLELRTITLKGDALFTSIRLKDHGR